MLHQRLCVQTCSNVAEKISHARQCTVSEGLRHRRTTVTDTASGVARLNRFIWLRQRHTMLAEIFNLLSIRICDWYLVGEQRDTQTQYDLLLPLPHND